MDKYYYLVSQLPLLVFDKETYLTTDSFLEEAEKWMSPSDYAVLAGSHFASTDQAAFAPRDIRAYRDWEYG